MFKNATLQKLMRWLITLLFAGAGAALAALTASMLARWYPAALRLPVTVMALWAGLIALGAAAGFLLSGVMIRVTMKHLGDAESRWDKLSNRQLLFSSAGLLIGLAAAALVNQLVMSAGASLLTVSLSALLYLVAGWTGLHMGYRRGGRRTEPDLPAACPRKLLDTSVIIDGRIADIVKTGFLEGELVVPQFVLAELRHIADSGDSLRRARGRRGLDVLGKLQKEISVTVDETDYPDAAEVDVKLLRLCRDSGGVVVTNDYNLNKVAGVTGLKVLNINDLSNAVKPMLMAGEEMNVQIVREGKEPGQGVAYLDDGTMIVVENGRRCVGENVCVVVTTVLQTSAGRMIFTRLKNEKAAV